MNLYEMSYTKRYDDEPESSAKVRKYQIPAVSEYQALIELGQMYPEQKEPPHREVVIELISIKKVK